MSLFEPLIAIDIITTMMLEIGLNYNQWFIIYTFLTILSPVLG